MTNKVEIPGLTANSIGALSAEETINLISIEIAKLPIKQNVSVSKTYYINNQLGSDVNSDGSIEKPFLSLKYAFEWVNKNVTLISDGISRGVIAFQLADSLIPYAGIQIIFSSLEIQILGNISNPSNVKINSGITVSKAELIIRGVTFAVPANSSTVFTLSRCYLFISDCIFEPTPGTVLILCRSFVYIQVQRIGISDCLSFIRTDSFCNIEILTGCYLVQSTDSNGVLRNPIFTASFVDISKVMNHLSISTLITGTAQGAGARILRHFSSIITNKNFLPSGINVLTPTPNPIKLVTTPVSEFLNDWTTNTLGVYYDEEGNGYVSLRGTITGSNVNTAAFILPFKPYGFTTTAQLLSFLVLTNTGTAKVNISGTGQLIVLGFTGTVTVELNNIRFRIA